jgi:hypothetical protein
MLRTRPANLSRHLSFDKRTGPPGKGPTVELNLGRAIL